MGLYEVKKWKISRRKSYVSIQREKEDKEIERQCVRAKEMELGSSHWKRSET